MPGLSLQNWCGRAVRCGGYLWRRVGTWVVPREFVWLYAAAVLLLAGAAGTVGVSLLYRPPVVVPPALQEQTGAQTSASSVPAAVPHDRERAAPPTAATTAAPAAAPPEKPMPPVLGQVQRAYGWQYYPQYGDWRFHPGVDIAAPADTAVKAALSGTVLDVANDARTGLTVVVAGGPGKLVYGSLARADVHAGDMVRRGQILGRAGTCPAEAGYHLHFAVADATGYQDPRAFLP